MPGLGACDGERSGNQSIGRSLVMIRPRARRRRVGITTVAGITTAVGTMTAGTPMNQVSRMIPVKFMGYRCTVDSG